MLITDWFRFNGGSRYRGAGDWPEWPAVYALISRFGDERESVTYVGQTNNLRRRLGQHLQQGGSIHAVEATPVPSTVARKWLERQVIGLIKPRDNTKHLKHATFPDRVTRRLAAEPR